VVAFHEAGHALLAMLVEHATPPERISIAADMEGALGYVLRAARARPYAVTTADMRADICVGLGGYVSERLTFGDVSIGAHTDLQQANRIARAMVEEYGMGTGITVVLEEPRGHDHSVSEHRRQRIDAEVAGILDAELQRAQALLTEHRSMLTALAETLLVRKVLDRVELQSLAKAPTPGAPTDG
jgi:cell division protease FtsH